MTHTETLPVKGDDWRAQTRLKFKIRDLQYQGTSNVQSGYLVWVRADGSAVHMGQAHLTELEVMRLLARQPSGPPVLPSRDMWVPWDRNCDAYRTALTRLRQYVARNPWSDSTTALRRHMRDWLSLESPYASVRAGARACAAKARQNLTREQRRELASAVASCVHRLKECDDLCLLPCTPTSLAQPCLRARAAMEDLADLLNAWGVDAEGLIDDVPHGLSDYVRLGECGHWHAEGDRHATRTGSVCGRCVDDGDWERDADSGYYYNMDNLYRHSDGDYYTYPEPEPDEQEDEDDEAYTESYGLHAYNTDALQYLDAGPRTSSATGDFTIGVELEVHAPHGQRRELVECVLDQAHRDVICKRDGSLDERDGVEIVTRPLSVKKALALMGSLDFPRGTTAWDTGVCGMHVHIDSRAFTKLSLAKFLDFWNREDNTNLIEKVAGRHPDRDGHAKQYARRVAAEGSTVVQKVKVWGENPRRHAIVNLCNLAVDSAERLGMGEVHFGHGHDTVELRVFRASLKRSRMLAQIEMAAASVWFARDASLADASEKAFVAWLTRHVDQWPHLASFLNVIRAHKPKAGTPAANDEHVPEQMGIAA